MDYRQKVFVAKFAEGARYLNAVSDQLISLKVREDINDHREYQELLRLLGQEAGVRSKEIPGAFNGKGYLVENSKTKVVVVEHETGLEILFIAGSVASLLGVVPLILRCWSVVRGDHHFRHRPPDFQSIESRRFDGNGELIEDCVDALTVPWAAPLSVMNTAMLTAAELIDSELRRLKAMVESFDNRLKVVEGLTNINPEAQKSSAKKIVRKRKGRKKN